MTMFRCEWKQIWYCQPVVASVVDGGFILFIGGSDAGRGCTSSEPSPILFGDVVLIGLKVGRTGLNGGSDGGSG